MLNSILDQGLKGRPSLRRNVAWAFAGDSVYAACQWGILIVLAKFGSAAMVGQYALGLAITAPIMMLFGLSLRAVQATDAMSQYAFKEYLALRVTTTTGACLLIAGVAFTGGYAPATALVIVCIGLSKYLESLSDIYYGLLQRYERMDLIAISVLIKGPLGLIGATAGLALSGNVLGAVMGLVVAWGAVLLAYDRQVANHHLRLNASKATAQISLNRRRLWSLAWTAWPLGFTMMLITLNLNVPRYFIEHYFGEQELGVFAALAHLLFVGSTVMNACGQTASPRLARYWAEDARMAFRALLLKLLAAAGLLGLGGVIVSFWAGHTVLRLLYRPEYAAYADVLLWLMVAAAVSHFASALGYGLTAARLLWLQPLQMACAVAAGVIASVFLIPEYGIQGAAWAIGISMAIQFTIAIGGIGYLFSGSTGLRRPMARVAFKLP